MGKIWLKSPDPTKVCCECAGKTGPCDSCMKIECRTLLNTQEYIDCENSDATFYNVLLNLPGFFALNPEIAPTPYPPKPDYYPFGFYYDTLWYETRLAAGVEFRNYLGPNLRRKFKKITYTGNYLFCERVISSDGNSSSQVEKRDYSSSVSYVAGFASPVIENWKLGRKILPQSSCPDVEPTSPMAQPIMLSNPFNGFFLPSDDGFGRVQYTVDSEKSARYSYPRKEDSRLLYFVDGVSITSHTSIEAEMTAELSEEWSNSDDYVKGLIKQFCRDSIQEEWSDWSSDTPCEATNGIRAEWKVSLKNLFPNTRYRLTMYFYDGTEIYGNMIVDFQTSSGETEGEVTGEVPLVDGKTITAKDYTLVTF